jgi:hypothetical protein
MREDPPAAGNLQARCQAADRRRLQQVPSGGGFTGPWRKCLDLRECECRTPFGHTSGTSLGPDCERGNRPTRVADRADLGTKSTASGRQAPQTPGLLACQWPVA